MNFQNFIGITKFFLFFFQSSSSFAMGIFSGKANVDHIFPYPNGKLSLHCNLSNLKVPYIYAFMMVLIYQITFKL